MKEPIIVALFIILGIVSFGNKSQIDELKQEIVNIHLEIEQKENEYTEEKILEKWNELNNFLEKLT